MKPERIEAPAKLLDALKPVQEQIDRLSAELRAAVFGARLALGVPDDWFYDGAGWVEPDNGEDQQNLPES